MVRFRRMTNCKHNLFLTRPKRKYHEAQKKTSVYEAQYKEMKTSDVHRQGEGGGPPTPEMQGTMEAGTKDNASNTRVGIGGRYVGGNSCHTVPLNLLQL